MEKRFLLKENIKTLVLAIVAVGVMALAGCNKDDDEGPTQNILEIVETTEGLDSLAKYLGLFPEVAAALEAEGSLTLFAPTNTAFIDLLNVPGFPEDIRSVNPDIIANVLLYHVSATRYNAADLTAGTEVMTQAVATTSADEVITVNQDGTLLTGSATKNIEIITADIEATNGVIHTTNKVLIPVALDGLAALLPTTYGTLSLGANFSILASGIAKADAYAAANQKTLLVSILTGTTFHTVFAPTNETLSVVPGVNDFSGETWYGIIANHVVLDDVGAAELTSTAAIDPGISSYESAAGVQLYFRYIQSEAENGIGVFIDSDLDQQFEAEVAVPNTALPDDLTKDNGLIHIIAGVMSPPTPQ